MNNKLIKIFIFFVFIVSNVQLQAALLMQGGYSHEFTVTQGGVYKKTIQLTNTGRTPQEIKIYLEDYLFSVGGKSKFTSAKLRKNQRSNSSWIKFSPNHITLSPGAKRDVTFTMTVPRSPIVGTYWSALVIEPISSSSIESSQKKSNDDNIQMNITQVSRHAVQIVAQVGNTGKINVKFNHPVLKTITGKRTFSLDAHNYGTRWIKPNVWLDIYDHQGSFIGKFDGIGSRIYPNTSVTLPVDISSLKSGKYKGLFVVDGGENSDVLATDINLNIK